MLNLTSFPGSISGSLVLHHTIQVLLGLQKVDVLTILPPMSLISFRYEDNISFQADNLELIFSDIGDRIINMPKLVYKGQPVQVLVHEWNRLYPGSHTQLDTGTHMIDQIKQIWPDTQTAILASSVPISNKIKLTLENRMRFARDIHDLANQIANENGLQLTWDSQNRDHLLGSVQQWNESDLQMLSRVCRTNGLSMKIKNGQMIIFDEQVYEQKDPVYTLDFMQFGFIGGIHGELTTQSQDIFSQAIYGYYDVNSSQTAQAATVDPNAGTPGEGSGSGAAIKSFQNTYPSPNSDGEEIGGGD